MTRKKYSHERKRKEDRDRNYAPDDIEDDIEDEDINKDLEIQQLDATYYENYIKEQTNPFIAFRDNYPEIIKKINDFRTIPSKMPPTPVITKSNIINDPSILKQLNTNLILLIRGNVASVYKGVSANEIQTTLKQLIINFFKKYPTTSIKSNNIEFVPVLITPSAVSNFYNMLERSYKTFKKDMSKRVAQAKPDKNFDEVFSLDDIDLMLSFGVLDNNKYYFKIPTKVSNTKIYDAIIDIYDNKNKYSYYFNLLKWFSENDYKYRLPILLFIDSYHDFSKKASGAKDKLLQTEINRILKLSEGSTIMTYYTNQIFNDKNKEKEYPFDSNTVLQDLNLLPTKKDRQNIFNILEKLVSNIYGKTFEKEFLYLYMYYFYIDNNVNENTIKNKLEYFQKNYVYNVQESPPKKINLFREEEKEKGNYTQDFLMRNESYKKGGIPVHFAVDREKSEFKYIPAALMDANKATSTRETSQYKETEFKDIEYNIGPFKILYYFDKNQDKCDLSVVGYSNEVYNDGEPAFQLYSEQTCKGNKIPIQFDEELQEYENNSSDTIAKKNIYKLNDKLKEIENTLIKRFNVKDIKNLSTRFIKFSNGSDGISRSDVLSLILAFSEKISKLNPLQKPTIQLIDRLLTLKRLGDFGQIINCKRLGIPLFTQDSMENLLAIATNTSTIFGNNPSYIYFKGVKGDKIEQEFQNPFTKFGYIMSNSDSNNLTLNPKPIVSNTSDINYEPTLVDVWKRSQEKQKQEEKFKYWTKREEENNEQREKEEINNRKNEEIAIKITPVSSLDSNLSKWLYTRFTQLSNKYGVKITNEDKIKVFNKYIDLIKKVNILEKSQSSDDLMLYLFIKYDLYDLINNIVSGYTYGKKNSTIILLETVLREILYDLKNLCIPNDDRMECKNIEDYLKDYKDKFKDQLKNDYTEDEIDMLYNNEEDYYCNNFYQLFNSDVPSLNKTLPERCEQYKPSSKHNTEKYKDEDNLSRKSRNKMSDNRIKSRRKKSSKLVKSSRDNLRKHHR
jgi:hypothetical protein